MIPSARVLMNPMTLIISWTQHWDLWWGVGSQEEGALSRSLNGTNCIGYGATSIYERGESTLHCP